MATNAQAQARGFATPGGGDYIRNGDDVISQNARAATQAALDAEQALAALEVTPDRTTFMIRSKNLFDPNDPDVMPGYALSSSGPVVDASRTITGWIPVKAGTTYTAAMATHVNVTGSDKVLLSGQRYVVAGSGVITFTTTVDGYVRASFITTTLATFQVEQGASATAHAPYGVMIPDLLLPEPEPEPVTTPTQGTPVAIPFAFTIPVTISRSSTGHGAVLDIDALHTRAAGTTLYVDPVNGSNSNDGLTWASAKRDPGNAAFAAGTYGAAEIIIKGGIYTRAQSPLMGRPDMVLRAAPGTRPVFTQCDTSAAWTLTSGTTYQVSLSGTGIVFDLTEPRTVTGAPVPLTRVADLATCQATPGSTYRDGALVYVNLRDGRAPDANVYVSRSTYHLDTAALAVSGPRSIFLDGIEFWGGVTARPRAAMDGEQLVARDCAWRWATDNGLSIQGFARTVLVDCEATHNGVDGFNYHDYGGRTGEVLEVNCIGRLNGQNPGGSSQNGTTAHDTYKIVRVGGSYDWNPGPNVADVNNVLSACYGTFAGDAIGYAGTPDWDYTAPELAGRLWLIDCTSTSALALRGTGATVTVTGFRRVGTVQPTLAPLV